MKLQSAEIAAVLRQQRAEGSELETASTHCDVVYALFLEPHDSSENESALSVEAMTEYVIRTFSPKPTLIHCELLVPPIPSSGGGKTSFATYIGRRADWQNKRGAGGDDGIGYYLVENGSRWRAVPVFAHDVARAARASGDANIGAPYSIGRYVTSARPLRRFAWMLGDKAGDPGHCATLAARVLKGSGASHVLPKASAWYCPSTLYNALSADLPSRLSASEHERMAFTNQSDCAATVEALTVKPLSVDTVRQLGDAKCIDAVRALTLRACDSAGDATAERLVQKQLAQVLLRWTLLREEQACAPGGDDGAASI